VSHRDFLPIPPIESATDPIYSPADLKQRWRALMQELGFGERLLRFAFVGPDRCLIKVLTDVEIGPRPVRAQVDELMSALSTLVGGFGDGTTVALLLTRPGRGGLSHSDRAWYSALIASAERFDVPLEPIFRANDESVVGLAPGLEATG
jgi:hypothetical protein